MNGIILEMDLVEKKLTQHLNPTPFMCRSAVRKFLLEEAGRTRAHKFTRVSEDTLLAINELVRRHCVTIVHQLPSKGKTI